jgi:ribosome-associated protein
MSTPSAARRRGKSAHSRPKGAAALLRVVTAALEDMKAVNVRVIDVRGLTDVADTLIIASGTSDRHVRSVAERVIQQAKASGMRPLGTEGEREGEWVLVDLQDIVVHVMLPRIRAFYALERLWEASPGEPGSGHASAQAAERT